MQTHRGGPVRAAGEPRRGRSGPGRRRTAIVAVHALLAAATAGLAPAAAEQDGTGSLPEPVEGTVLEATRLRTVPRTTVIGPQDLLEVRVFQLDSFDQTLRVGDDGAITLPLLGRVDVAGLTRDQVERAIAARLEERYINDPQVSVFVREHASRKVAVTGAVTKPGTFEMLGERTLLEMIAEAGGVTAEAASEVVVIRRGEGGPGAPPRRIAVNLRDLVHRGDPAANIPLRPGDIVYLPLEETFKVYVNGAVGQPGAIEVRMSESITVLQAVTSAGGTTERASERRVQIIRRNPDGSREIVPVNLRRVKQGREEDPLLKKDDIVFVPEAIL